MTTRRHALALLAAAPLASAAAKPFLIAHRGGIVGNEHAENSPASVESAIQRGYPMIEVDIRRTKDGRAIVHHDPTFLRYFGLDARVSDLTWSEIQKLRATPGNTRPMDFEELCARCQGRIRLMLDIKGEAFPDDFYAGLEASLSKHNLLRSAFTLGGGRTKSFFKGKLWLSANRKELQAFIAASEPVDKLYFLFELGSVLDAPTVALCHSHNVVPVAALNTFRYEIEKIDHFAGARRDISKLKPLGVTHFQIDSIYDSLLLG